MSSDAQKALAVWAKAALNGKRGAQARLARELNLSPEKISRFLNGERELSFWEVVAIAKMFDKVPPGLEDFLGGNPQASPRVESRLEEIERKIDALARHLGASEGRSASAAEAKRCSTSAILRKSH